MLLMFGVLFPQHYKHLVEFTCTETCVCNDPPGSTHSQLHPSDQFVSDAVLAVTQTQLGLDFEVTGEQGASETPREKQCSI